jgi:hypothetical protein
MPLEIVATREDISRLVPDGDLKLLRRGVNQDPILRVRCIDARPRKG